MDPNKTHREMMNKARAILDAFDADDEPSSDDVSELANAIESLDKWLREGGIKPTVWT